jgi:uncharacterized membrane protein
VSADGPDDDAPGPFPPPAGDGVALAAPQAGTRLAPAEPARVRSASVWRDPVIWVIAVAAAAGYFVIALMRLLQDNPASYDLAIYVEYVKQLSQLHAPVVDILGTGFNLLGNHFQPAVGLLAPFFRLVPSAGTLLFGQAVLTAVSVFPVASAAAAFGGRTSGRLIGFAYAFSWGLQQLNDYDFHEVALAVPLLAFSLSALVRRRPLAAIAWAVPMVFVKEDQGFTVAAIGVLLGMSAAFPPSPSGGWRARVPFLVAGFGTDRDGRYRDGRWGDGSVALWGGLFLLAWGLLWSVLAITVIIPHFNPSHDYYFLKDAGVANGHQSFSVGGVVQQTAASWPVKLRTLGWLLLPTAFIALGSPLALLALPGLGLRFMSTNTVFWGTAWHYNATTMPILFIAAAEAIGRLHGVLPARRAAKAAGPAGDSRAAPESPESPGAGPDSPAAGEPAGPASPARAVTVAWAAARRLTRSAAGPAGRAAWTARAGLARNAGVLMAGIACVLAFHFPLSDLWHASTYRLSPHVAAADAAIAVVPDGATVQSTLDVLAPLAARTDTFWIGTAGNPATQYIVFDGADSGYSPAITNVPAFIRQIYPRAGYVQVFERDDVYVFRRG